MVQPRLALATGFNGGSDGGDRNDPASALFREMVVAGNRCLYIDPHQRIATFDQYGDFRSEAFDINLIMKELLFGPTGEFERQSIKPRDMHRVLHSEKRVQEIQERAHFYLLEHQQKIADKMGGWIEGELKDIEVCLEWTGSKEAMGGAFREFSRGVSFANWCETLAIVNSHDVVVNFPDVSQKTLG